MTLSVAFRVDATSQIGTGHFMRCLTLAGELKIGGARVCFVSRGLLGHLREMLVSKDIECFALSNATSTMVLDDLYHSDWLQSSQAQDAIDSSEVLADHRWDWLIVDHYALDIRWESAMRQVVQKIMVIDDLADRVHDCDILLDQNCYIDMQTRYATKVSKSCKTLLGPRYALLREEFREERQGLEPRTGKVKKVLVFFGGVDANDFTSVAIEALRKINYLMHVDVVVGAEHPHLKQIKNACSVYGFDCHVQTMRMAELMAKADLAIGAGGTAIWERCCLGLPTLSYYVADNQRQQISGAAEAGLLFEGLSRLNLVEKIHDQTHFLLVNPSLIRLVSRLSMSAVDGRGALRISRELHNMKSESKEILLRKANADDAIKVWPWRNHENTRRYSFDTSAVSVDKHIEWWNQSLHDPNRLLLLGSFEDVDFGVIRFDFEGASRVITSIYLNPLCTGKGFGRELLISGITWLCKYYPNIKSVVAEISPENLASIRMFKSTGFQESYAVFRLDLPVYD